MNLSLRLRSAAADLRSRLFLAALLSWIAVVLPAAAETLPEGRWLSLVGTSVTNAAGQEWSYLFWQSTDPAVLRDKPVLVYFRDGATPSTRSFFQRAEVSPQTDAHMVAVLLERGEQVGDNLAELDEHLTRLFGDLRLAPGIRLSEKLAAVVRAAAGNPALASKVQLLCKRHPAAAMAFGVAFAEPFAGTASFGTYELRIVDTDTVVVVGRVVPARRQPLVLPAPGPVVEVPTNGIASDRTARIRWSTPDDLRRLSLAMNGYNVYRVERSTAIRLGLTNSQPAGVLAALAAAGTGVERVNVQPVFPPVELNATQAADLAGDPSTVFVVDTRDRDRGGSGFRDGDQFCFFVTARDVLGRDGISSDPGCVALCDRLPPPVPMGLRTANDFVIEGSGATNGRQRIRLTWPVPTNAAPEGVAGYRIYRWSRRDQVHEPGARPTQVVDVAITNAPRMSVLDLTADAPDVSRAGTVFWYTLRSVKRTACGDLESADGAPVRAIPRDRVGPKGSPPKLVVRQPELAVTFQPIRIEGGATNLPNGANRYWISAVRTNREVEWVEVEVADPALPEGSAILGRHHFPRFTNGGGLPHATTANDTRIDWGYVTKTASGVRATVRFGLVDGTVSATASQDLLPATPGYATGIRADLGVTWRLALAGAERRHYPVPITPGGSGGAVTGVGIVVPPTADTHQYRVYRRLDDGPLTLVAEGDAPQTGLLGDIALTDGAMPVNPAAATYSTQLLDRDGNAGPLVPAEPLRIARVPAAPTLLSVVPGGTNGVSSNLVVTWSGAPYGLARYRVWVGNPNRASLPLLQAPSAVGLAKRRSDGGKSADTVFNLPSGLPVYRDFVHSGGTTNLVSTPHDSARIGQRTGVGAIHSMEVSRAATDADLYLVVEAIAEDGAIGEVSNTLILPAGAGTEPPTTVPWPKRALPLVRTNFTGSALQFEAVRLKRGSADGTADGDFDGVGIALGYVHIEPRSGAEPKEGRDAFLNGQLNPVSALFHDPLTGLPILGREPAELALASARLPAIELPSALMFRPVTSAVLYRQQVPSPRYPQPAGDILQVGPLMSGIAHRHYTASIPVNAGLAVPATQILDPFVAVFRQGNTHGIYLLDTQPLIEGAAYRYYLLRFGENGEMIDVLPTKPLTVSTSE